MEKLRWWTGRGLGLGRFDFLSNENILLTHYQLIKMNPKVIRIYLIIMGIIGLEHVLTNCQFLVREFD
jgi:hypothetical protein